MIPGPGSRLRLPYEMNETAVTERSGKNRSRKNAAEKDRFFMITAGRLDSLKWQSRRGMKEIDLMLEPFVTRHIPELPEETVSLYEKLLLCSDLELIRYLLRNVTPEDPDLRKIVDLVISCHKQDFPDAAQGLE